MRQLLLVAAAIIGSAAAADADTACSCTRSADASAEVIVQPDSTYTGTHNQNRAGRVAQDGRLDRYQPPPGVQRGNIDQPGGLYPQPPPPPVSSGRAIRSGNSRWSQPYQAPHRSPRPRRRLRHGDEHHP